MESAKSFENKEGVKYEIGRVEANGFNVYATVNTEEEAQRKYLETISRVSNPTDITIFEAGGEKCRNDIIEKALATQRVEVDPENVSLDQEIDMDTERKLGFSLMQGTTGYDYLGQPMSLDEMAKREASSVVDAKNRHLQTSVDVGNGIYVSWMNPESKLAKMYRERLNKYIEEEEKRV